MAQTSEPRHRETGETLSEVISQYPGELDLDAVGIWQIVPDGKVDFGFSGDDLTEYIRRAIRALLDSGAVPVKHIAGSGYHWTWQKQYGTTRDEITEAIIQEYLPVPHDSYSLIENCPWFARPRPQSPKYVQMD